MDKKNDVFNEDIEIIDDLDSNIDALIANENKMNESNEYVISGPDLMSDFMAGIDNELDLSTENFDDIDNSEVLEDEISKDEEDRVTEVLNKAEIMDADIAAPIEEKKETLAITHEEEKEIDSKKGMIFIIILFIILIIFIIALPEITKIIQKITG
ncbi:MAG: hypothetical protein GX247_04670 [Mollicutes bacterium]|jgi:hypothetical protein|nr:hypothetical protein [Mollicutes bacterium]